jgi:lipoate-protein ligase A
LAERWRVEVLRDGFAERAAARPVGERSVVVFDVTRPTLVLGSSQADDTVDRDAVRAGGVDVVRRRSGGSAVLVEPGAALWVDVTIPPDDPLWCHDVGRAFHWLGAVWVDALARAGVRARWHDGPMRKPPWSASVCFAGLGPGEVLLDGGKAVGMSQRRTRTSTLFQCCVMLRWDPQAILALLALGAAERSEAARALAGVAAGIGPEREAELDAAFLAALAER